METSHTPIADPVAHSHIPPADHLEIIRFPSADARKQAIGVLMDRGMLNFTTHCQDEWLVRTSVARALRALGVPFEWLTEHASGSP